MIARQVVEPGTPALAAIAERFGNEMLLPDGALNRAALRQRIFSHPDDKTWLNQLLHPLIHRETQRQLAQAASPYALWVVPLLVENGLQDRADRVLVIDVDAETQLARTIARDGVSREQAQSILAARPRAGSASPWRMTLLTTAAPLRDRATGRRTASSLP